MNSEKELWEITQIIDDWYFEWKHQFPNVPHPFGFAKENLKSRLCEWVQAKGVERLMEKSVTKCKTARR